MIFAKLLREKRGSTVAMTDHDEIMWLLYVNNTMYIARIDNKLIAT